MLKELIDKYYQEKAKDYDRVKFYISDAAKCPRQIFFKFKKAPAKKIDARLLRIFDQGNYVHLRLMRDLFALNIVVASEIDIPPNEDIVGRADAIIRLNNQLYVVDFKSINSSILSKMTEPKKDHIAQIQLYLHFFNIKNGILLYEGKDNSLLKEFLVKYDRAFAKKLIGTFSEIKKYINQDIICPRLPDWPHNWQCQYCPFRKICKMAGPGPCSWAEFKEKIKSEEQKK
ncbi:CRISPR-associated protein Cas4 [bacterium]|nr:CRISPR-associated protein Cas4 [bacterium]